jgi:hypothetical protein
MQVRVETVSAPILDSPDTLIYFCRKQSFATVERRSGAAVGSGTVLGCTFMRENYLYHFVVALE